MSRLPRSLSAAAGLAVLAALVLAACASSRLRGGDASDRDVRQHERAGYIGEARHAVTTVREAWTVDGEAIDVALVLPSGSARYPLVVYLPGLGESASGGAAWRRAWAEAGYAVLSVQPASEGRAVWSSGEARLGEFRDIARSHFSAASLQRRVELLGDVFTEIERRAAHSPAYQRIDVSRIAVAGFDLGAQTAMVVAGERIDGVDVPIWPATVKAVVALSPYADFSGMGLQSNFRGIRQPVLGVTSGEDTDAYGFVTSPTVRRASFEYMPPGEKYLLVLSGAPHSLISGRETSPQESSGGARSRSDMTGARESDGGAGGRGPRFGARNGPRRDDTTGASRTRNWRMELANVEGVTTAFLDATVNDDSIAREWLREDAGRWLGDSGRLLRK